MAILGFNKIKQHVELVKALSGKVSISNNVSIKEVNEAKVTLGKEKQDVLRIVFEFSTNYAQSKEIINAFIKITGEVIFHDDSTKMKTYLKQWNKDKKLPRVVMEEVLNVILTRSNIDALNISQDFNLPPPIPLPKINVEKESQSYIG